MNTRYEEWGQDNFVYLGDIHTLYPRLSKIPWIRNGEHAFAQKCLELPVWLYFFWVDIQQYRNILKINPEGSCKILIEKDEKEGHFHNKILCQFVFVFLLMKKIFFSIFVTSIVLMKHNNLGLNVVFLLILHLRNMNQAAKSIRFHLC